MAAKRVRQIPDRLSPDHPDYADLVRLEESLYRHAGGKAAFDRDIPALLRQAIDEVIDTPRSKRFFVSDLEKTEKAYIGTKVEILLRNKLGLERGSVMDLLVDGYEVDVKNTIKVTWTIPNEALGHLCILISANEETAKCSFGLIRIRADILNAGRNRDQKTTIRQNQMHHALWMLFDADYPQNFWQQLSAEHRSSILRPRGGTERLAKLFELYQRRPISRDLVHALGQQLDYMKRLRRNGGARDILDPLEIALLGGKTHKELIQQLGLQGVSGRDFVSLRPENERELQLLGTGVEVTQPAEGERNQTELF